jgi:hypothetical protein
MPISPEIQKIHKRILHMEEEEIQSQSQEFGKK